MKKFLLATVALVALGATVPALAADLAARPQYTKAPAYAAPHLQLDRLLHRRPSRRRVLGRQQFRRPDHRQQRQGRFLGGLQGGADYQFAPNWVVGAEAQYSWLSGNNGSVVFPNGNSYTNNQRGLGSGLVDSKEMSARLPSIQSTARNRPIGVFGVLSP